MKEISAGGVVFSKEENEIKILLIEDRYGRWSLPKGKQEAGESLEETALREIREETGILGKIVAPLETIHYHYYHPEIGDTDKEVHYFLVEKVNGDIRVQIEEIRSVYWLTPKEAWKRQKNSGYDNNQSVLKKALERLNISIN